MEQNQEALSQIQNVRWLDYTKNLMEIQRGLHLSTSMFDVILSVGESRFKAHQIILSACSPFFNEILCHHPNVANATAPPVIIIPDINANLVEPLIIFMYTGETLVPSAYVSDFLDACHFLQIKGLSGNVGDNKSISNNIPKQTLPTLSLSSLVNIFHEPIVDNKTDLLLLDADDQKSAELVVGDEEYLDEETTEEDLSAFNCTTIEEIMTASAAANNDIKSVGEDLLEEPIATTVANERRIKSPRGLNRNQRNSTLEHAMRAVTEHGCSLKEASSQYNLSKTALWRRLKQSAQYKPEDRQHRCQRTDAMAAIEQGETLISISKRLSIPLSTLHRDKVRLFNQGKLPENCKLNRRDATPAYRRRLQKAVICCRNGMTQKKAADLYSVPKTTIWRHLQAEKRQQTAGPIAAKVSGCETFKLDEHEPPTILNYELCRAEQLT